MGLTNQYPEVSSTKRIPMKLQPSRVFTHLDRRRKVLISDPTPVDIPVQMI